MGNLAYSVKNEDLEAHFPAAKSVTLMTAVSGRSKGCAIIEFESSDGAEQAIKEFHDSELQGRRMFLRKDREPASGKATTKPTESVPGSRVYVGNLSWSVRWQELKDHMREAGNVLHAQVMMDSNRRSKGCGIVEYATKEEAEKAMETLNDSELQGRKIFVREDRGPRSASS